MESAQPVSTPWLGRAGAAALGPTQLEGHQLSPGMGDTQNLTSSHDKLWEHLDTGKVQLQLS